ncbi:MAG: hypothetical protein WBG90_12040 [Saonia sp.]
MRPEWTIKTYQLVLLMLFSLATIAQNQKYTFDYSDIEKFRDAYLAIESGADPLIEMTNYFNSGSPGLKSWVSIYGMTPEKLAVQVEKRPKFYKNLLQVDEKLKTLEGTISRGYTDLLKHLPNPNDTILPTYYFVLWGGGGSVRPNGSMISVDYFGGGEHLDSAEFPEGIFPEGRIPFATLDDVPQVAIHEMVHWFQRKLQGSDNYVSIYGNPDNSTLLAYAIREGGADMITRLATGLVDKGKNEFGKKNEKEIWEAFKPSMLMNVDKVKGWFSGGFADKREWPFQIGYYLGMEITQYYYDRAKDKEAALNDIFTAYRPEHFTKFVQVYEQKFMR